MSIPKCSPRPYLHGILGRLAPVHDAYRYRCNVQETRHRIGGEWAHSSSHPTNAVARHGHRLYAGTASNTHQLLVCPKSMGRSTRRFFCVTRFRKCGSIPFPGIHSLIRWYQGYIPLPKSSSEARIRSNLEVYDFELTPEEVAHLDSLDESAFA